MLQNADGVPAFWQESVVQELPSLHCESERQEAPVTVVAISEQLVAPFGAVQEVPEILEVPALLTFTVEPETEATEVLEDTKEPPLQPEGAEAVVDAPVLTVDCARETWLVGQTSGWAVQLPSEVGRYDFPFADWEQ